MKRVFGVLIFIAILSVGLSVFRTPVYAESILPYTCDASKGNYKETSILTVVPLDSVIVKESGITPDTLAKGLLYELAYQRGNVTSPINAVLVDGILYPVTCSYADYSTNVVSGVTQGQYIVVTLGEVSGEQIQKVIDSLKLTQFKQATLHVVQDSKNPIALANEQQCTALCAKLTPSKKGTESREFKIEVGKPNYPASIRQKEQVSLSIILNNNGDFPLYSEGKNALQLVSKSSGVSALYHPSWLSPNIVSRINATLLPGAQTTLAVTIGAPLQPGKYTESFQLVVGGTSIGSAFDVSFTVENDNYKLGKIVSKDDSPYANFRETPSLSGNLIGKIDVGTVVIIKEEQDLWIKIETKEGKIGWVYRPFLRSL